jgi:ERCC4-type nuclease
MLTSIIADNREAASGIPQMLAKRNAKVQMAQLSSGDYIINY